jgi:hypothetical protein
MGSGGPMTPIAESLEQTAGVFDFLPEAKEGLKHILLLDFKWE